MSDPSVLLTALAILLGLGANLLLLAYGYGRLNNEVKQAKAAAERCLESHAGLNQKLNSIEQGLARLEERGVSMIALVQRIEAEQGRLRER